MKDDEDDKPASLDDMIESEPALPMTLGGAGTLDQLIAVALFVGINSRFGLAWAVAAATAWSVKIAITRRRQGIAMGKFLPLVLGYLVLRGLVGVVTDSEAVYFGIGIGTKVVIGLVLLGSVLARRNLASRFVPMVLPFDQRTRLHPTFDKTMAMLTLIAAAFELLTAVWDVWLYNNSTVNGYVIIRFVVGYVLGLVVIIGGFLYAHVRLSKIPGFEGLPSMLERMADAKGKPVTRPQVD